MVLDREAYISEFVQKHFKITLYGYQIRIIDQILNENRKVSIRATTRAGKSYAVAIGCIAYAFLNNGAKVGIIAPTYPKTRIIMDYIAEMLSTSDLETAIDLDVMGLSKLERLKREVSKHKITFRNGSYIEILSADVTGHGFGAMGKGFTLQVIDETAEIPDEVYTKIYRMLVDSPISKIVEIGNPWHLNHFFEHSTDPTWIVIKINWQEVVKEGRISKEDIEDQRNNMSAIDFTVMYEAEFPPSFENSLFPLDLLKKAQREIPIPKETPEVILGIDVARMGSDKTVIYLIHRFGGLFMIKKKWEYGKQTLTDTAGKIILILSNYEVKKLNIDSTGIGAGLTDMLNEYISTNKLKTEVKEIIFSEKADDIHNMNRKADIFMNLSKIFADGNIIIPKDDNLLFTQLSKMLFELQSNGKKKIDDNQEKSPDCADALSIGCYVGMDNFAWKW